MPRAKLLIALSVIFLLGALTPYLARTAEEKPRELPALKMAYLDMGKLFTEYKSYKEAIEKMKTQTGELETKFKEEYNEMKELAEALKKLQPTSDEFKKKTRELEKLEMDFKFRQKTAREEFEAKINKVQYTVFERIEVISQRVCDQYDIGLLLRHNTSTINPRDPKDVLRAINGSIVYADPRLDLTRQILAELEKMPPLEVAESVKP
jgi:Skp family chaperone for outer membrane proteins